MPSKPRIRMPSAAAIVARSYPDNVIGVDNQLPWHLRSDLAHFRERTSGHAIIMGRRTFLSIGRPLPNRVNIVLSRESPIEMSGVIWAGDVETALFFADVHSIFRRQLEFFVIGGEQIYSAFLLYINRAYVTDVFTRINGDAKFDYRFDRKVWKSKSESDFPKSDSDEYPFRITEFVRRAPFHRFELRQRFLGFDGTSDELLEAYQRFIEEADPIPNSDLSLPLF